MTRSISLAVPRGCGRTRRCASTQRTCCSSTRQANFRSPMRCRQPVERATCCCWAIPLQLAQVAKAEHPGSSGASVLEHMLGDAKTIHERDGVFLSKNVALCTRTCVRSFLGKFTKVDCIAIRAVHNKQPSLVRGLRWLEAKSVRRSTFSDEEATIVLAQVESMLGYCVDESTRRGRTTPSPRLHGGRAVQRSSQFYCGR